MTPTQPTLEDLRRELHDQADAARAWPAPVVPHRRAPTRPWRPLAVLGTVLAVVAVVLGPHLWTPTGGGGPASPVATPAPSPPPASRVVRTTRDWVGVDCPGRADRACRVPDRIAVGARELVSLAGGSVPTHHRAVRSPELSYTRQLGSLSSYLLVGAVGSDSSSRLELRVAGTTVNIPSGRLSVVLVPPKLAGHPVVLVETARPLPEETLTIEEYQVHR